MREAKKLLSDESEEILRLRNQLLEGKTSMDNYFHERLRLESIYMEKVEEAVRRVARR